MKIKPNRWPNLPQCVRERPLDEEYGANANGTYYTFICINDWEQFVNVILKYLEMLLKSKSKKNVGVVVLA